MPSRLTQHYTAGKPDWQAQVHARLRQLALVLKLLILLFILLFIIAVSLNLHTLSIAVPRPGWRAALPLLCMGHKGSGWHLCNGTICRQGRCPDQLASMTSQQAGQGSQGDAGATLHT